MKHGALEEYNEWWWKGRVPTELAKEYRRSVYSVLVDHLRKRHVLSLVGLRRIGKTTLMYQLIDHLLQQGVEPRQIMYFSFDERVPTLDEVVTAYREEKQVDFREKKAYLFLDEIQKVQGWSDQVKKYYDLYPKLKIVLSGSEGLFVSRGTKEMLAGRVYEFHLKTLSFSEYLAFCGISLPLPAAAVDARFHAYITEGGFPEVIGMEPAERRRHILSSVVDKIVFQDVIGEGKARNAEMLRTLIEEIAVQPGIYLNYDSLSQQLGVDRRAVSSAIMLLEQSFLVKILSNYRHGRIVSRRKLKRAYVMDTGISAALKGAIDETFFGKLVESAVVADSYSSSFWRNGHEVDLIEKEPVEVKYRRSVGSEDVRGIRVCMRRFGFRSGLVITREKEGRKKVPEGVVRFIPAARYFLEKKSAQEVI